MISLYFTIDFLFLWKPLKDKTSHLCFLKQIYCHSNIMATQGEIISEVWNDLFIDNIGCEIFEDFSDNDHNEDIDTGKNYISM